MSVTFTPVINAPFSATVVTEWTHLLPDGSTSTVRNHRSVARDSSGRIFQERRMLTPTGDKEETRLQVLEYHDPARHEISRCFPEQKTCYMSQSFELAQPAPEAPGTQIKPARISLSNGATVETIALGQKRVGDLDLVGSREITTLPAAAIGSQHAEPLVKEFWYSPQLAVNVVIKRFDPMGGIQNFQVENISLAEPNPELFMPPADFKVVQMPTSGPIW